MSRFRLYPTPAQETALLGHCAQAQFGWNLALEQANSYGTTGRKASPNFAAQCPQLTEARAEHAWLTAGSQTVQQQARRDLDQAWRNFYGRTHRRPTWRKAGRHEGFRLSRAIPDAKSYRVTRDSAGRWHIAFAAIPAAIPAPGTGEVVGADRGVAVAAALSSGELRRFDTDSLDAQVRRTQRRLCRAQRGSHRRRRVKARLARRHARRADARQDWVGKLSTDLARRFDLIRVEDLRVRNMTRSAKGTVDAPGDAPGGRAGYERPTESRPEPRHPGQGLGCAGDPVRSRRPPAGWRRSTLRTRRSGATPAGTPRRSRARAKRASSAGPAATPRTPT